MRLHFAPPALFVHGGQSVDYRRPDIVSQILPQLGATDQDVDRHLLGLVFVRWREPLERLRVETSLSVAAIRAGGAASYERDILDIWAQWYDGALSAMEDIEVGGASSDVRLDIDAARMKLGISLSVNQTLLVD